MQQDQLQRLDSGWVKKQVGESRGVVSRAVDPEPCDRRHNIEVLLVARQVVGPVLGNRIDRGSALILTRNSEEGLDARVARIARIRREIDVLLAERERAFIHFALADIDRIVFFDCTEGGREAAGTQPGLSSWVCWKLAERADDIRFSTVNDVEIASEAHAKD